MSRYQDWKSLAAVQVGGAICLPVLLFGQQLAKECAPASAMIAIGIGNLFLLLLAGFIVSLALRERLSTAALAAKLFGPLGHRAIAMLIVISMAGWFLLQNRAMASATMDLLGWQNGMAENGCALLLGLGIGWSTLDGMHSLAGWARVVLPLLLVTLTMALWQAYSAEEAVDIAASEGGVLSSFHALSLVLACAIGGVIDMPTFMREAKSRRDSWIAIGMTFGLALPLIQVAGLLLAQWGATDDLVGLLTAGTTSPLWHLWVGSFVVLAGWTTNNMNLFSAGVSSQLLLPGWSEKRRIALLGLLGAVMAPFASIEATTSFLELVGVALTALGGLIVADGLCTLPSSIRQGANSAIMLISCGGGAISWWSEVAWSGVALLDSFVIAALLRAAIGLVSLVIHYSDSMKRRNHALFRD